MDPRPAHRPTETGDIHPVFGRTAPGKTPSAGIGRKRPRHLRCPVCGTQMELRMVGDVEIDQCPDCLGIFLDRGELALLKGSDLSSYSHESRPEKSLIYTPHGLSPEIRHPSEQ